jgi:hypothetical protein
MKITLIVISFFFNLMLNAQIENLNVDRYKWVCSDGFYYDYFPSHGYKPKPLLREFLKGDNIDSTTIKFDTIVYSRINKRLWIKGSISRHKCYTGNDSKALIIAGLRTDTLGDKVDYISDLYEHNPKIIGKVKFMEFHNFDYCYSDLILECYQRRKFDCTLNIDEKYDFLVIGMSDAFAILYDINKIKINYGH